jgi:hypothetical protein
MEPEEKKNLKQLILFLAILGVFFLCYRVLGLSGTCIGSLIMVIFGATVAIITYFKAVRHGKTPMKYFIYFMILWTMYLCAEVVYNNCFRG